MNLHGIEIDEAKLAEFCRAKGITELLFFGSITRKSFRPDSDIDVFVRYPPEHVGTMAELVELMDFLECMSGRRIHLHTDPMLPPKHRDYFLRGAVRKYAA